MIRIGLVALTIIGSTALALAETPPAGAPSTVPASPAAPATPPAQINPAVPATASAPALPTTRTKRTTQTDVDVLLGPTRVKHRVGPLRGTPIVAGNPAIRVDGWGQVITSEQP